MKGDIFMNIKEELRQYIDLNYEKEIIYKQKTEKRGFNVFSKLKSFYYEDECVDSDYFNASQSSLNEYIENEKNESNFQTLLFKYIDSRNLKDSDVYNKVNIDRRLFSKIRNSQNYHPSKETVILLAIALNLNEDELLSLLNSASYSLPKNNIFDLIIRFCFKKQIYDLNQINELLYEYRCKTLN